MIGDYFENIFELIRESWRNGQISTYLSKLNQEDINQLNKSLTWNEIEAA
jgi:hypothetical protein